MIAAAFGSFLVVILHSRSDLSATVPPTPASRVVVFVIDGAPPSALQPASLTNIKALASRGVTYRNAWVGQLENLPIASSATLGTGVWPKRDGVIGQEWRDPATRAPVRPGDLAQVQQGTLDQTMESSGAPSLAAFVKGRDPAATVLSVGGEGCGTADAAGTWLADFVICPVRRAGFWVPSAVTGHSPPGGVLIGVGSRVRVARPPGLGATVEGWVPGAQDNWIARETVRAIRLTKPRLTFVNFPEYGALARYAPPSRRGVLRGVMQGIDRDIGEVVAELAREHLDTQTSYVITSDGAVSSMTRRESRTTLSTNILAAGGQLVYVQAGSAAMVGLQDLLQAQPVAQAIQGSGLAAVDAIFYKAQSGGKYSYQPQYMNAGLSSRFVGAALYLLDTMVSAAAPDLALLYAPHAGTPGPPLGRFRNVGTSLGVQWDQQHVPLLVAGHGTFQGLTSSNPARLVDVAPTIAALLGGRLRQSDGAILADAFIHPPAGATTRLRSEAAKLQPLVSALKHR